MQHAGLRLDSFNDPSHASAAGPEVACHSGFGLVLEHLTATVKAVGADVVPQVDLASGGLHCDTGHVQGIVRTVHAALGRRFFVLLDGHDGLLWKCGVVACVRSIQPLGPILIVFQAHWTRWTDAKP
jgi:hypothetical protein